MIAATARPRNPPLGGIVGVLARAPFAARTWLATTHIATGALVGAATLVTVTLLGLGTILLGVTVVLGAACLAALFSCADRLGDWQRARFAEVLDVRLIAPERRAANGGWLGRLVARCQDPVVWRQLAYHAVAGLLDLVGFGALAAVWAGALGLIGVSLVQGLLGSQHSPATLVGFGLAGVALVLLAPWLARVVCAADVGLARTLLGVDDREALIEQVESLVESRAGVIDAADAERRRIERNLHDGTQQRLTSLAMNLGLARETLADLPPAAREAIVEAHENAKETLAELRAFVRGLHPPVLDDRGLAAALSGITARSVPPVRLTVDVEQRPSRTIEAVAYFVVSESLTNVTKHAQAASATVTVRRAGDRLHVQVADDGRGGASEHAGSGLRGLRQRVASVDGTLHVHSPAGQGTVITVELPCE